MNNYAVLGVQHGASLDEIKKAYKRKVMEHHPDRGGDADKFRQVTQAYESLTNKSEPITPTFGSSPQWDLDDMFARFGAHMNPRHQQIARVLLRVDLEDAVQGGKRLISLQTPQTSNIDIEVDLPRGVIDGQKIKYGNIKGLGVDLIVEFRINPNKKWQRVGDDLYLTIKLPIWQLITGSCVNIITIYGRQIAVTIPERFQPGRQLRLAKQGVHNEAMSNTGDLHLKVEGTIPLNIHPDLLKAIQDLSNN